MPRRKTLRQRLAERLSKRLESAVEMGAITQAEADEMMEETKVGNWMLIIQMIMMIAEIIATFLEERDSETEEAGNPA